MTADELRKKFLNFFKKKSHSIISGAPLVPENDPTVLFTTAGMHPLVPYLMGETHPDGKRLANVQKCIRTGDIDAVGDDTHLTFFEMLGNWSLGDYFKKEAIKWSHEFLSNEVLIPEERIAISVFAGAEGINEDVDSKNIWLSLGITENRIKMLGMDDNWWGPAGNTGPCGPDTEIFYWAGELPVPQNFNPKDSRWIEIWNDVFMEYNKDKNGKYEKLPQKNVDTGMGLERMLMVLNGKRSVYDTDLFVPIIDVITENLRVDYANYQRQIRIIADHAKAACFIIADGVVPSNKEQGYVLRRLIRRTLRYAYEINNEIMLNPGNFLSSLVPIVSKIYAKAYPELEKKRKIIADVLYNEESKFLKVISGGIKKIDDIIKKKREGISQEKKISGTDAFDLYQSYGFPPELTEEILNQHGFSYDKNEFIRALSLAQNKHREISRAGSIQKFSGGLADHSAETTKLHTSTHILHTALRMVLGDTVFQKGSNITKERLRFDFSYPRKMTSEEIKKVEKIANEAIKADYPVRYEIMDVNKAKEIGAIGLFEDKYARLGNKVKVYIIGDEKKGYFSKEICGGPHVEHTGVILGIKIVKEEAVSAGIRRIKAILG